jgi:endoglucanase
MDSIELLLKKLSEAFGPSGFESDVRKIMNEELTKYCPNIYTDGLGSLIAELNEASKGPKIMVTAHMDEVGLLVKYVDDRGYVKFQQLGGWLDQALIGQRWHILTKKGKILGVSGIKTPHVMSVEEKKKIVKSDDVFIDVGAENKKDAETRLGIFPGAPIAPVSQFEFLGDNGLYIGKAWDDRIGLAVMTEVARSLKSTAIQNKVFLVSTVQEEVGLRGAGTSSFAIEPDIGINIESGVAGDYPGISKDESQEQLGCGPTIFLHDSMMLPNLKLRDLTVSIAKELEMDIQFNVLKGYGEDGAAIQKTHKGTPTINIAVPTRYLHSHNGVISRLDFDDSVKLISSLIQRLDTETVKGLKSFEL